MAPAYPRIQLLRRLVSPLEPLSYSSALLNTIYFLFANFCHGSTVSDAHQSVRASFVALGSPNASTSRTLPRPCGGERNVLEEMDEVCAKNTGAELHIMVKSRLST
ncbi:hypothetical protein FRB91_002239 [Serendipita sp. 411]|nr:hypothetical protein FRB91_002239 [Serendipita sp. 411]